MPYWWAGVRRQWWEAFWNALEKSRGSSQFVGLHRHCGLTHQQWWWVRIHKNAASWNHVGSQWEWCMIELWMAYSRTLWQIGMKVIGGNSLLWLQIADYSLHHIYLCSLRQNRRYIYKNIIRVPERRVMVRITHLDWLLDEGWDSCLFIH